MKYFLIVFWLSNPPVQIGPFHDILACEKASNQIRVLSLSSTKAQEATTGCVGQKNWAFKLKEKPNAK